MFSSSHATKMFYKNYILDTNYSTTNDLYIIATVNAISLNRQNNGYLSISNMGYGLSCSHANIVFL